MLGRTNLIETGSGISKYEFSSQDATANSYCERNQSCACALERADGSSNHDGAFDITAIAFKTRSVLTELATQPWKGPSKHLTFETMER